MQGVGFRPFVYAAASALGLAGSVSNTPAGVVVEVEGDHDAVDTFARRLVEDAPPLAEVEGVHESELPTQGGTGFHIGATTEGESEVVVENCTFFDLDAAAVDVDEGAVRNTIVIQTGDTLAAPEQDHNVADFSLAGATYSTAADLFVAPTASPPDLHLSASAVAALENGADLRPGFEHDIDGDLRGSVWDIGADQRTAAR